MSVLRDTQGAGKLGKHVVQKIHEALDQIGLSHFPEDLPINGWERARNVILAALTVDEHSDEVLLGVAHGIADSILKKLKNLCVTRPIEKLKPRYWLMSGTS